MGLKQIISILCNYNSSFKFNVGTGFTNAIGVNVIYLDKV